MYGANVIIFEGILTFHNPEVRDVRWSDSFSQSFLRMISNVI
jgi:hypothetical protein